MPCIEHPHRARKVARVCWGWYSREMRASLLLCIVVATGCTKITTPYEMSYRPEQPGNHRYLVTIRVHDDMEDSVIKEYLFRRANELCPNGWDTKQDTEDLEVDDSSANDQKSLAMDISCRE